MPDEYRHFIVKYNLAVLVVLISGVPADRLPRGGSSPILVDQAA